MFQSTHSLRSATLAPICRNLTKTGFNPRTPYGVRPGSSAGGTGAEKVSIHALLTECDFYRICHAEQRPVPIHALLTECDEHLRRKTAPKQSFNPRTPYGVRPLTFCSPASGATFQSTHSLRSATPRRIKCGCSVRFQSTHSLRSATGRFESETFPLRRFNPRTPYGVRLRPTLYIVTQQSKSYFAPTSLKRPSLHGYTF